MSIPKQLRYQIGQDICEGKLTLKEAMDKYHISKTSASRYKLTYATEAGLDVSTLPTERKSKSDKTTKIYKHKDSMNIDDYKNMTKEELIEELIRSKVNEARAKKGYEVKGDGPNRVYSSINNKTSR